MNGDTEVDQPPIYGSLGVTSPTNQPGGRFRFASWTGSDDTLWLFGGERGDGMIQLLFLCLFSLIKTMAMIFGNLMVLLGLG